MQKFVAYEAVYLLTNETITKEMRFSEFEAVLDRYISVPEFINKVVKGIYIAADDQISPMHAVLFALPFDGKGLADARWHLNLSTMAPMLNAQLCGIPIVQREGYQGEKKDVPLLWTPKTQVLGEKALGSVLGRLKENRLGFNIVRKSATTEPVPEPIAAQPPEQWKEVELQLRQKKDELAKQIDELNQALETEQGKNLSLERHYQKFIQEKDEKLSLLNQKLKLAQQEGEAHAKLSARSQAKLIEAEEALESLTERYEAMIAAQSEKLQALEAKNDAELIHRLKQQNQRLAIDREYLDGVKQKLETQLEHTREQLQQAVDQSAEGLLKQLQGSDVEMVVYHPGSGHTAIAPKRLMEYLDDPQAWAAEHCGVSKEHYLAWLEHFDRPVCKECGKPAARVNNPIDFDRDKDVYCMLHKQAL
ncbi:hypothetical protein [Salinibius halmophilus]|uniref:hypothetical protein n=1 Tax=Salinibius halmophilus TaxID=1853216 RepID=UPI001314400D|nr:hypothetical protein [Salinibius halmophilus]